MWLKCVRFRYNYAQLATNDNPVVYYYCAWLQYSCIKWSYAWTSTNNTQVRFYICAWLILLWPECTHTHVSTKFFQSNYKIIRDLNPYVLDLYFCGPSAPIHTFQPNSSSRIIKLQLSYIRMCLIYSFVARVQLCTHFKQMVPVGLYKCMWLESVWLHWLHYCFRLKLKSSYTFMRKFARQLISFGVSQHGYVFGWRWQV